MAEKRKALLDELAIKYQKEYDTHREQSIATEEKHQEEVKALQDEITALEVGFVLFCFCELTALLCLHVKQGNVQMWVD